MGAAMGNADLPAQRACSSDSPARRRQQEEAASAAADAEYAAGPLRVLVAEDNLVNQKVLQKVLQRVTPNSPMFIANNGQEALQVRLPLPRILLRLPAVGSEQITAPELCALLSLINNERVHAHAGWSRSLKQGARRQGQPEAEAQS